MQPGPVRESSSVGLVLRVLLALLALEVLLLVCSGVVCFVLIRCVVVSFVVVAHVS